MLAGYKQDFFGNLEDNLKFCQIVPKKNVLKDQCAAIWHCLCNQWILASVTAADDDEDNDLLGLAADDSDDDDYSMYGDSDEGESSDNDDTGHMMKYHNQLDGADDSDVSTFTV